MGTEYQLVVEIARRIEGYQQRGREQLHSTRGPNSLESLEVPQLGAEARHLVEKGCLAYLGYVWDTISESPTFDSVPVVREFADVFPSDLPGMPPDCDIDFCIDLVPGTQPISIPPYIMAPKDIKELKEQLEELLAKGFMRPSVSLGVH
ncbi:uncharacterized protein [Nicotiana sylvestris]|uniref:uncharacterized protein n=1 Tax=Nicotiana sylvestris TaxID=4096 RepID=UPI00388C458A